MAAAAVLTAKKRGGLASCMEGAVEHDHKPISSILTSGTGRSALRQMHRDDGRSTRRTMGSAAKTAQGQMIGVTVNAPVLAIGMMS